MKLTACWIVKNEEKTLVRSIESVREAADELIVVDTGSTDSTRKAAAGMGARVEEFAWIDDFSAARNHALSLATGDVVLFLDADEWFVPALDGAAKKEILSAFQQEARLDALQVQLLNIDGDAIRSSYRVDRLFRNRPELRYRNPVHERMTHSGGRELLRLSLHDRWKVCHSGYEAQEMPRKMARNIQLLEQSLEKLPPEGDQAFMQHLYLLREYNNLGQQENALPHLNHLLSCPEQLLGACREYGDGILVFFYAALECAAAQREKVSRKEIHQKLVTVMKQQFPRFAGSATVELLYQAWFDLKEDRFLAQLPGALKNSELLGSGQAGKAREMEAILRSYAAQALWRRQQKIPAMEYAAAACNVPNTNRDNFQILLGCVRGQLTADLVGFITSFYNTSNPDTLAFLVRETRLEGFQDLHAYFVKKQVDAGAATAGTFLYLQLLLGKLEESISFALDLGPDSAAAVAEHLFLVAVTSGEERYWKEHRETLAPYERVLEAFFAGKSLEEITEEDAAILVTQYRLVALAGGLEQADRLLSVFSAAPILAYRVKARYCLQNERYEELLEMDTEEIPSRDAASRSMMIRAMLLLERHEEAFQELEALFAQDIMDAGLLRQLLVVAQYGPADTATAARELYDRQIDLCDTMIDLRDVVATEVAFDPYTRKQLLALRSLSMEALEAEMEEDAKQPAPEALVNLYQKAGAIYEEKQAFGPAYQCYRWLLAHQCDREESRHSLARVLRELGNKALAQELLTQQI